MAKSVKRYVKCEYCRKVVGVTINQVGYYVARHRDAKKRICVGSSWYVRSDKLLNSKEA